MTSTSSTFSWSWESMRGTFLASKGWQTTCGGFLIHLVLGTLYLWSIITVPVTSYLRKYNDQVTYDSTVMVYGAAMGMQGLTYILGGLSAKKFGNRNSCLFGSSILVCGCCLASICTSLDSLLVCFGLMFGVGLGFCYTPPIGCATSWLPQYKGTVTGIIVAGFGGGSFIFSHIASSVLYSDSTLDDPRNQLVNGYFQADSPVVQNVPKMFLVLAVCYGLLMFTGCWLLAEPNQPHYTMIQQASSPIITLNDSDIAEVEMKSNNNNGYNSIGNIDEEDCTSRNLSSPVTTTTTTTTTTTSAREHQSLPSQLRFSMVSSKLVSTMEDVEPKDLMKTSLAWHVTSCLITTTIGGMYLLGTYKVYGQIVLGDDHEHFLSLLGGVAALFNAGGRICWGFLGDRIGPIEALMVMSFVLSLVMITYPLSSFYFGTYGFGLWTFAIFACEGGNFALYMPVVIMLFGSANCSPNFAIVATFYALVNVCNIALLSSQHVSFEVASRSMGLLTLFGFINVCLLRIHAARKLKATLRCD